MKKHSVQRLLALCLTAFALISLMTPALAAEAEIIPACDETYYATLDAYGALTDSSVVKTYHTYGNTTITDYGAYTAVTNLTDGRPAQKEPGKITFDLTGNVPDKFYFEGKTAQPYKEFPWTLSLSYALNGVPVQAEDLAGKSGVAEITLTASPNEKATEYSRSNLILTAASVFNGDDILSLEAPGAQVQLLGNLYCVLYAVLPGETRTCTIRVGTEDFSYSGMVFLAVPATLGQLEQITALKDAQEDLEGSYRVIADSMDTILASMESMNGSLNTAADGLDRLNEGREVLFAGKDQVYADLDIALDAAGPLAEAMKPAAGHLKDAQTAMNEAIWIINEMDNDVTAVRHTLSSTQQTLRKLKSQISGSNAGSVQSLTKNLTADLKTLQDMNSQFQTMGSQLDQLTTGADGKTILVQNMPIAELKDRVAQANALHETYETVSAQMPGLSFQNFVAYALIYQNTGGPEDGFAAFLMTQAGTIDLNDPNYQTAVAGAAQLTTLYQLAQTEQFQLQLAQLEQLQSTLERYNMTLTQLKSTAQEYSGLLNLLTPLCEDLTDLTDALSKTGGVLTTTGSLTDSADNALWLAEQSLDRLEELNELMNDCQPKAQKALKDAQTLTESASAGLTALVDAAKTGEALLKNSGPTLDEGTRRVLSGTADTLRGASVSLNQTANIRQALRNIDAVITDQWNNVAGEERDLLNIDPTAPPQSITSEKNEGTVSIQYVMRTQEIKAGNGVEEAPCAKDQADTGTFFSRVKTMFTDLWSGITGIFS